MNLTDNSSTALVRTLYVALPRGRAAGRVFGFVVGGGVGCGAARGAGIFSGDESTSIGTSSINSIQQPTAMVSCDTQRNDSLTAC